MDDVIELSFGGSVREKVRKLLATPTSQTPASQLTLPRQPNSPRVRATSLRE